MSETELLVLSNADQNAAANLWPGEGSLPDTISAWAERYFRTEVTTGERSRKEQDFRLFLAFLRDEIDAEERERWTPRVSREFIDYLRSQLREDGRLEIERAITVDERRRLLDAADHLPVLGGRSKDRRRYGDVEFADERPRRKGYRPFRNRAIIYTLIETGMRRAEVTSIDLLGIDGDGRRLLITEKGGRQRQCPITKQGMKAIGDYLKHERGGDAELFPESPALFLPAETIVNSRGRLSPSLINRIWNDVCVSARVKGRPPHSARHAMGVDLVRKSGNPRSAQRQLGHKNPSTTMQYMQYSEAEHRETLEQR